jgi:MraZ protein
VFVFSGEFEHSLDGKGRLIIPVRFRPALEEGYFLTKGLDGCLWLFPKESWQDISERLQQTSIIRGGARRLDRMLFAGTDDTLDNQGRLLVPPSLRSHAGLELNGAVTVVGVKNRIELWEPAHWHAFNEASAGDGEFAEQLEGLGI